jgi:AcrR family transcriptional regulator
MTDKKKRIRIDDVAQRKKQLFEIAIEMAVKYGYRNLKRKMIAEQVGCSTALVSKYFLSIGHLRRDILNAAIRREVIPIIAEGIAAKEPRFKRIKPELKQKAIEYLKTF